MSLRQQVLFQVKFQKSKIVNFIDSISGHFAFFTDNMTIFERMQNLISQLIVYIAFSYNGRMELDAVEELVGKKDTNV